MEVDYTQFEKFADEIANKYPIYALESAQTAFDDMGAFLLSKVPEYPDPIEGRLMPPDGVSWLKTDQQRRWFFAAVKSGDIKGWQWVDGHPEKSGSGRTGNLGRSLSGDVTRTTEESLELSLGFDDAIAPYAPWVVGDDFPGEVIDYEDKYQAKIHADRWWQFRVIIEENVDEAWRVFNETFWEEFSKRIES